MTLPEILQQLATVRPSELLEDAPVTRDNFNNLVKSSKLQEEALIELKDRWGCPPIGGKYTRLPGVTIGADVVEADPLPGDKWPGTAWRHISSFYANKYFRVVGNKTLEFGMGEQGWALVDHKHNATPDAVTGQTNVTYADGRYSTRKFPRDPVPIVTGGPIDNSVAVTVADEVRVENFAIEIYERIPLP